MNLLPISALITASAVRAARQTFCEIDQWYSWLKEAAFDCLPTVLPLRGVFTPPGWTQASVVEHAFNSKHSVSFSDDLERATEEAIAKVPQGRSIRTLFAVSLATSHSGSLAKLADNNKCWRTLQYGCFYFACI